MFIVYFVEYLTDVLEKQKNLFICIESGSKFVHSDGEKKVFSICVYLQFGRGVTGIRRSSPSAVGLALCDASFVLFLPHKDLK